MDIDADFDLISQFRTMNTNDKDYLVAEFKRLSNTQLPYEGCRFYLDLAEWFELIPYNFYFNFIICLSL